MTFPGMLYFLMLITFHNLILTPVRKKFLVLGEGQNDDNSGSVGNAKKKISIKFNKTKAKLCLSFHYSDDNSYSFINGK